MNFKKSIDELVSFIDKATCSFTTVTAAKEMLTKNEFVELKAGEAWKIDKGGKYYVDIYAGTLIAFTVGKDFAEGMLRIVTSHTDSPSFSIKPNPEMVSGKGGFGRINVEGYGGAILNTWLDRPLSVAAKVSLKSKDVFKPEVRIIDIQKPVLTIPNLAVHMNREVNKGIELNKQVDMLPIGCQTDEDNKKDFFIAYLAKALDVKKEEILDFEAYVYNTENGKLVGMNEEFLLCPRLDNTTSTMACLKGIIDSGKKNKNSDGINMVALFDNEEIGSTTKQGAGSIMLSHIIEKIYLSMGVTREAYLNSVLNGMLISLDVAHGAHPNHPEKNDPTNDIVLNKGPVIKRSGAQRYATDARAIGIIEQICNKEKIPYQKFALKSDMLGGSTLGPILDTNLPMLTVDIGVPILAMHSANETMGMKDQAYVEELVKGFFTL